MKKVLQTVFNFSSMFSIVLFASVLFNTNVKGQTTYCPSDGAPTLGAEYDGCTISGATSSCAGKIKWIGYSQATGGPHGIVTYNNVQASVAGTYSVTIGYTHFFNDGAHIMRINVNGVNIDNSLTSTGDWCTEATTVVSIPLNAGTNTLIFKDNGSQQSPDLTYFTVPSTPTGIQENSLENNVKIYTENKEIVIENNVSNEQGSVIIYDMLGKVISDQKIEANSKLQISYANDTYSQQIYFVQVYMNNQTYTKKIFLNK